MDSTGLGRKSFCFRKEVVLLRVLKVIIKILSYVTVYGACVWGFIYLIISSAKVSKLVHGAIPQALLFIFAFAFFSYATMWCFEFFGRFFTDKYGEFYSKDRIREIIALSHNRKIKPTRVRDKKQTKDLEQSANIDAEQTIKKKHRTSTGPKVIKVTPPREDYTPKKATAAYKNYTNAANNVPSPPQPIKTHPASSDYNKFKGCVYCLSNPAMPDLYKIGYTSKLKPYKRARDLYKGHSGSGTGVPAPFKVEFYCQCMEPHKAERELHRIMNYARFNHNREFFKCPLHRIEEAFKTYIPNPNEFKRGE